LKLNFKDYYFTLDLDKIDIIEAGKRFNMIIKEQPVFRVILYLSSWNGWHIEAFCYEKIHVAKVRRRYKDDGARLIHDLIDRMDSKVHDVLWQEKNIGPYKFNQMKVTEWHK